MKGARHVFVPQFQPVQVLQTIQAHLVTMIMLVPTMINVLLNYPEVDIYDVSSLSALIYAADLTEDYVDFNKGDVSDPSSLGG